ncbi:hypothetical protein SAMN04488567_0019 [Limimaricola pyoseonensis]|uniref:Uncharacterized protein n=1 Tax=Limimaricola pyoseonensis TaxID=521013 RepID=A0A1G7JV04_9RHOB|nr:hypothetical protein SAMN04488567_0019 [Limimaricola pyoseonensis]
MKVCSMPHRFAAPRPCALPFRAVARIPLPGPAAA